MKRYGVEGLLEVQRCGSPPQLSSAQLQLLRHILNSGPVAYGLYTGILTSPMIAWVIEQEFGVHYHPGHVRKLLHELGFSMQRPRRVLAKADPKLRTTAGAARSIPILKKSPNPRQSPDLQRRSQLPPRIHLICDVESRWPAARDPRDRTAQERQNPGSHRTVSDPFPLPPGDGLQRLHLLSLFGATGRPVSAARRHSYPGLRPLPQKTAKSGRGSEPIDTGWRCTNCRLTPRSSTLPNDFGNTRAEPGPTTGTSLTPPELLATLTRVFTEMQCHPETIRPHLASFC